MKEWLNCSSHAQKGPPTHDHVDGLLQVLCLYILLILRYHSGSTRRRGTFRRKRLQILGRSTCTGHRRPMVHILGVQLFENSFVKVLPVSFVIILCVVRSWSSLALYISARLDTFLWNKSPYRQPYLRSPANPRQVSRPRAVRNTNNNHHRFPFLAVHLADPPACASCVAHVPTTPSLDNVA